MALSYDYCMESSLSLFWETIPELLSSHGVFTGALAPYAWTYTLVTATLLAACAGLAIKFLGFAGTKFMAPRDGNRQCMYMTS